MHFGWVFLGAGLGGALRHGVNLLGARAPGAMFPWATMTVNVLGSLLMGLIVAWLAWRNPWPLAVRLFLTTGVLGGFTTFSAFSLEVVLLFERGQMWLALLYALASVLLSVLALAAGMALVRAWSV
ncbi:MAG TPA: fluoride efflux transporter CrcB [Burkholderiaceae bacterium]|nr:fluoride efflux transporter CrcB [Burkholderiaceae bacterium]